MTRMQLADTVTTCFTAASPGSNSSMPPFFKKHSIEEIETCLSAALSTLFGQSTSVLVDQVEMSGAFVQSARLVIQANEDQSMLLEFMPIDKT